MLKPQRNSQFIFYALLLLLGVFLVTPVMAQDSDEASAVSDDEVNEVAKEVYCPVCESTPLDVCQTQACADWRDVIRTKLAEGQSKEEIFNYFADQYGDRVLATPPREGVNWLLWIWPVAALLVGGFFFTRYVKSLRDSATLTVGETAVASPSAEPNTPDPDDYISRVEQELNK